MPTKMATFSEHNRVVPGSRVVPHWTFFVAWDVKNKFKVWLAIAHKSILFSRTTYFFGTPVRVPFFIWFLVSFLFFCFSLRYKREAQLGNFLFQFQESFIFHDLLCLTSFAHLCLFRCVLLPVSNLYPKKKLDWAFCLFLTIIYGGYCDSPFWNFLKNTLKIRSCFGLR